MPPWPNNRRDESSIRLIRCSQDHFRLVLPIGSGGRYLTFFIIAQFCEIASLQTKSVTSSRPFPHINKKMASSGGGITLDQLMSMDVDSAASQHRAMAEHKEILDEFDRRRRARTLAVPTDDGQVRARLREFGEPITLFGEGPGDRRERLREIMSRNLGEDEELESSEEGESEGEESDEEREEFYTEGSEELYEARKWIAEYSLRRWVGRKRCRRNC